MIDLIFHEVDSIHSIIVDPQEVLFDPPSHPSSPETKSPPLQSLSESCTLLLSSIDKLQVQLSSEFKMKDLREVRRKLNMKIERDRVKGRVSLIQKAYLQKVLRKFLIGNEVKSVSSLLAPHFKLSARMSPKTIDVR